MKRTRTLAMTLCAVGLAPWASASAAEPPFATEVPLSAQDVSSGIEAHFGDLDNDGDLDVVFGGGTSLWWFENEGLQDPMTERNLDAGLFTSNDSLVTDVDDDGDLDVVSSGGGLRWYENIEQAAGFTAHVLDSDDEIEGELGFGDVDGDGLRDVVLANTDSQEAVWYTNGDGEWGSATAIDADFNGVQYLVVADLVGDGRAEVVIGGGVGGNDLGLLQFDGSWMKSALDPGSGVEELRVGDVDGDMDLDLLVGQDEHAVVLRNLGGGTFGPVPITDSDGSDSVNYQLVGGDIDGDGDIDLVAQHFDQTGGLSWFENVDGEFEQEHLILDDASHFATLELGDADCDGDADLLYFGAIDDLLDVYILENTTNDPAGEPDAACIGAGDDGAVGSGDGGGDDTGGDDSGGSDGSDSGSDGAGDDGSGDDMGGDGADEGGSGGDTGASDNDDGGGLCSVHPRRELPLALTVMFFVGLARRRRH